MTNYSAIVPQPCLEPFEYQWMGNSRHKKNIYKWNRSDDD